MPNYDTVNSQITANSLKPIHFINKLKLIFDTHIQPDPKLKPPVPVQMSMHEL